MKKIIFIFALLGFLNSCVSEYIPYASINLNEVEHIELFRVKSHLEWEQIEISDQQKSDIMETLKSSKLHRFPLKCLLRHRLLLFRNSGGIDTFSTNGVILRNSDGFYEVNTDFISDYEE